MNFLLFTPTEMYDTSYTFHFESYNVLLDFYINNISFCLVHPTFKICMPDFSTNVFVSEKVSENSIFVNFLKDFV